MGVEVATIVPPSLSTRVPRIASLYNIYSPPQPNSFRAVLSRTGRGREISLSLSLSIDRAAALFSSSRSLFENEGGEKEEDLEEREKETIENEGKRSYMRLLFVRERERGRLVSPRPLISPRWGPPIGHMKAKKPKLVVDLVLHRPLN